MEMYSQKYERPMGRSLFCFLFSLFASLVPFLILSVTFVRVFLRFICFENLSQVL